MALGKLGTRATISDLAENSVEAREISRWYDNARDVALGGADWNFARVYRALSLTGTAPSKWTYSYAYPSDCLKFRGFDLGSALPYPNNICRAFEVASDGILSLVFCDLSAATGIYTQRVTSPSRFDPDFTMAFATILASMVALSITQKQDLAQQLKLEARALLEDAQVESANEQASLESLRISDSLATRGYSDAWTDGVFGPLVIDWNP